MEIKSDKSESLEDYQARIGAWQDERDLPVYNALDSGPLASNDLEARLADLEHRFGELATVVSQIFELTMEKANGR